MRVANSTGVFTVIAVLLALTSCAQVTETEPAPAPISIAWHSVQISTRNEFGAGSDHPVLPASTVKLVTALAVLDRLSPDTVFVTRVCRSGNAIALIGSGDPAFDVEDLLGLALTAKDDMAGATALTFAPVGNDGPIQPKQPIDAAYNPRLAGLMVAEGAYRGHRRMDGHGWSVPPGAPVPKTPGTDWVAHPDPPRQTVDLFHAYASGMGVDLPEPIPGDGQCDREIARHESAPVPGLVREMLWTSSNPMAELLGRQIGRAHV